MHSRQVGRIQNSDFSEVQNLVILQVILLSYLPPHKVEAMSVVQDVRH